MKYQGQTWSTRLLAGCLTLGLSGATTLYAQSTAVDLNALRKELARAQIDKGATHEESEGALPGFRELGTRRAEAPSVEIKDEETRDMLSAEQKLLQQLKANEGELVISDFARDDVESESRSRAAASVAQKAGKQDVAQIQDKIEATDAKLSELGSDISAQMASLGRDQAKAEAEEKPQEAIARKEAAEAAVISEVAKTAPKKPSADNAPTRSTTRAVSNVADEALAKMEGASKQISALQKESAALRMRLQSAEQKNALLSKQLSEARNRLLVAETEVERLSSIIENRTSVRTTRAPSAPASRAAAPAVAAPAAQRQAPAVTSQRDSDMPFVTVMVDKANLRLGPNTSDSPVMTVSRGTRLTVETRQGPWFRVYAPNGNRLWVSADVVAFGKDAMSSPSETVRIRAVGGSKIGDNFTLP